MENTITTVRIEDGFPTVINFNKTSKEDFVAWYKQNEVEIDELLLKSGGILFRGMDTGTMEDFSYITNAITNKFLNYVDGFSPRKKLSSNIYTSTEYDADFYITLHNELSYSSNWPSKIFFYCETPAQEGGATPIVDGREILRKLRPELFEEFEEKGVKYVRNLHSGGGLGPSWQTTYETEDKGFVEKFCSDSKTEFEWNDDGGLRLIQRRPSTIEHPITKERVWFNQVDQFHPCHMEPDIYETLMDVYNHKEENLPMFGSFGDDSAIAIEKIKEVRKVVDETSVPVNWQKGDLLMLDNVLAAHGRMPYKGYRKVLVAMSE